jgi:glycosyltransferase involved in cell wall biosynthesis
LRLAVDATPLLGARTGIGVVTHELLTRFAERDDLDVVAYATTWRGRHEVEGLIPAGVSVTERPMAARPLRAAWLRADVPPLEWWTGPIDVVLGTNFVVPPTRHAARVATVHDLTAWRFPELCTDDTRQYPTLVERALRSGAHIIVPTQAVADELVEVAGARPDRVHKVAWAASQALGGDPLRGRAAAGADRYVLSLGTIEPRKDHALLVRAFDRAAAADSSLHLVVAGPDGWGVERYDAAVAAARHRDRIIRLGWVDDTTRADLLAGATVLAYPSVYEGFGLPPLEALGGGVPVVATALPTLVEVLGGVAELVTPGDDAGLAAALLAVAGAGDAEREARARRGRERVAMYSWDQAVIGVIEALTEAAAASRTIPRS